MNKLYLITNEMYGAYYSYSISNVFYGTWMQAARECVAKTEVKGDIRSVEELKIKKGLLTNNYLS